MNEYIESRSEGVIRSKNLNRWTPIGFLVLIVSFLLMNVQAQNSGPKFIELKKMREYSRTENKGQAGASCKVVRLGQAHDYRENVLPHYISLKLADLHPKSSVQHYSGRGQYLCQDINFFGIWAGTWRFEFTRAFPSAIQEITFEPDTLYDLTINEDAFGYLEIVNPEGGRLAKYGRPFWITSASGATTEIFELKRGGIVPGKYSVEYKFRTYENVDPVVRKSLKFSNVKISAGKITKLVLPIIQSDLRVVEFSNERKGTGDNHGWVAKAIIENKSQVDIDEDFSVGLYRRYFGSVMTSAGDNRPALRPIENALKTVPGLKAGESKEVIWEFGKTNPLRSDAVVREDDNELVVYADYGQKIAETNEKNNSIELEKHSCDPRNESDNNALIAWVEHEDNETKKGLERILSYLPEKTIDEKKNKALCYIRLEAQRLARIGKGTVAGSTFLSGLEIHLSDYLENPTEETAVAAIQRIGKTTPPFDRISAKDWVALKLGYGGYMRIPSAFRLRYKGIKEVEMFPAYNILFLEEGVNEILLIDVPFLLGENYPSRSRDQDEYVKGGRNWSNVMHWATGVNYHHFPDEALQELFLGYEYWHMEGFDTFGEDAINDLIAEEQGRLFGKALFSESVSSQNLVSITDGAFSRSRAWVGAIIRAKQEELDNQILAAQMPRSNIWWGSNGKKPLIVSPWHASPLTIHKMFESGVTFDEIVSSKLVKKLVRVYELIYEVEEWEKRHGKVNLTPLILKTLNGDYDNQFKRAEKDYETKQDWWKP